MKEIDLKCPRFLFNYTSSLKSLYEFIIEPFNLIQKSKVVKDKQATSKWNSSGCSQWTSRG